MLTCDINYLIFYGLVFRTPQLQTPKTHAFACFEGTLQKVVACGRH